MRFVGAILLLAVSLSAQDKHTHTTFTPSSAVIQQDDNTWYIGAETVLLLLLLEPGSPTLISNSPCHQTAQSRQLKRP